MYNRLYDIDIGTLLSGIDRSESTLKHIQHELHIEHNKLQLEQQLLQQQIDNIIHGQHTISQVNNNVAHHNDNTAVDDPSDIDDVLAALMDDDNIIQSNITNNSINNTDNNNDSINQHSPASTTLPPISNHNKHISDLPLPLPPNHFNSPTMIPFHDSHSPSLNSYTESQLVSTPYFTSYPQHQHSNDHSSINTFHSLNLTAHHTPLVTSQPYPHQQQLHSHDEHSHSELKSTMISDIISSANQDTNKQ